MTGVFVQGLVAGLAVALPLGAIGVLLLHEGFTHGWRPAAAGATGVAVVDLGYAAAAGGAGSAITSALRGHERAVHLIGAAVLAAVAVRGLLGLRGAQGTGASPVPDVAAATRARTVFTRFVALTAVNPLTAVYFAVLAGGLALTSAAAVATFALAVFTGSWAWQLVLAGIGALAGERMPAGVRLGVGVLGYAIVLGYAVRLAL